MTICRTLQPAWLALAAVALTACGGGSSSDNNGSSGDNSSGGVAISGTPPPTAQVGLEWSFTPTITAQGNNGPVTVTGENLPGWTTLQSGSGRLRGTPDEGDVRTWSNIRLRVTDGQSTASLPAFSITVLAQGAAGGTALLRWTPPTERVDGSPLGSLSGYRILYGQASMDYGSQIQVGAGVTSHFFEDLAPGTWYFAVTAITSDGLESDPSEEASKGI